jgi:hypothetical protein
MLLMISPQHSIAPCFPHILPGIVRFVFISNRDYSNRLTFVSTATHTVPLGTAANDRYLNTVLYIAKTRRAISS